MRFHDGCEKDMTSNQLAVVTVEKIPVEKEPEVTMITVIPYDAVDSNMGCYHCVYAMQDFTK